MKKLSDKRIRMIELIIVLVIALSPYLIGSIHLFITNKPLKSTNMDIRYLKTVIHMLFSILVLWYVFFRRGRKLKEIGFNFSESDIFHSILLFIVSFLAYYLFCMFIVSFFPNILAEHNMPKNNDFLKGNISFFYLLFIIVSSFFSQIFLTAYTINELTFLTKREDFAVFFSVILKILYCLYQGAVPAILLSVMFFTYSVYYTKYNRIMPLIMANLLHQIIAIICI